MLSTEMAATTASVADHPLEHQELSSSKEQSTSISLLENLNSLTARPLQGVFWPVARFSWCDPPKSSCSWERDQEISIALKPLHDCHDRYEN